MKITEREFILVVAIALMGFVFSMREWILWLDTLNPLGGLLVYYFILYVSLIVLGRLGLVVFNVKIDDPLQTGGLVLVTYAFFAVVNNESPYVQFVTGRSMEAVSPVFYGSEDGALFWFFQRILPFASMDVLRVMTFIVAPFIITLIGTMLVSKKIRIK